MRPVKRGEDVAQKSENVRLLEGHVGGEQVKGGR
jgi:hypothetical protein